jgi:predicted amidohydrolase
MMIKPYTAVGLIPTVRGIKRREEIRTNLEHISHLVKAAAWLSSLDLPVRLLALPEGALQGFNDEVLDIDHADYARDCAIDIPGPETEALGDLARGYQAFVIAQAKARHPEWKDRFFNVAFILDPSGEVILRHYKVSPLFPVEHSVCPHDVFDWWIERYGNTLDAFWPVADTEIGRLGIMMANEGSYPENARALALNGAEVVYRASYPHPATGNDMFEIQSRARALDNNIYVVAPNMGTYFIDAFSHTPIDTFGGRSFIVDYRGRIVGKQEYGGVSTYVAAVIDVEALRYHRETAQWDNWLKDLRTELYQLLYKDPIYPKNLYLNRKPMKHTEYRREVIDKQIDLMHRRGVWKKSSYE